MTPEQQAAVDKLADDLAAAFGIPTEVGRARVEAALRAEHRPLVAMMEQLAAGPGLPWWRRLQCRLRGLLR